MRRVADLAHEAGALAWVDAVHYAPHGPIDVAAADVDVLICSPYKFFGPHLGLFFGKREVLEHWRPYKVRPSADEPVGHRFETGTLAHELLAGCTAAVDYIESIGWDSIVAWERELGQRFLDGLPEAYRLHGIPSMEARTPTFALTHPSRAPDEFADELARRDIAAWPGNYYALEIVDRLGLTDGCLRVGIVHYRTHPPRRSTGSSRRSRSSPSASALLGSQRRDDGACFLGPARPLRARAGNGRAGNGGLAVRATRSSLAPASRRARSTSRCAKASPEPKTLDDPKLWTDWLAFLQGAAENGGLIVQ